MFRSRLIVSAQPKGGTILRSRVENGIFPCIEPSLLGDASAPHNFYDDPYHIITIIVMFYTNKKQRCPLT